MKLNKKQTKRFHRLNEKLHTSPDYFLSNSAFFYCKYKYLLKPRFLINVKLKVGVNSRIIIYNSLSVSGYVKKKQRKNKLVRPAFDAIQKRYPFIFKPKRQKKKTKKVKKNLNAVSGASSVPVTPIKANLDPIIIEINSSSDDEIGNNGPTSAIAKSGEKEKVNFAAICSSKNKIQNEVEKEENQDKEARNSPPDTEKKDEKGNNVESGNYVANKTQVMTIEIEDDTEIAKQAIHGEKQKCIEPNGEFVDSNKEKGNKEKITCEDNKQDAERNKEKEDSSEPEQQQNKKVDENKDDNDDEDNENGTNVIDEAPSTSLSPDEINRQLREQLKLLQMGKRNVSLFSRSSSTLDQSNKSTSSLGRSNSISSLEDFDENSTEKRDLETSSLDKQNERNLSTEECTRNQETSIQNENTSQNNLDNASDVQNASRNTENDKCKAAKDYPSSLNETSLNEDEKNEHNESSTTPCHFLTSTPNVSIDISNNPNKSGKFLDNLLSKLRSKGVNSEHSEINVSENSALLTSNGSQNLSHKETAKPVDSLDDDNNSVCSASSFTEFVGFVGNEDSSYERQLLETPFVPNSYTNTHSAFLSEDLDTFMKENALDNPSNVVMPAKPIHDDALKWVDAEPPTLSFPELPDYLGRPRTVAEKRQILEKRNDLKYLMIENESTVYRELKKRSRTVTSINSNLIRDIQSTDIPFTRDCWRATTWLNTDNGKFYFQTIPLANQQIKIFGGRGNNESKVFADSADVRPRSIKHEDKCSCKCEPIDENIKINGFEMLIPVEPEQATIKSENISNDLTPRKKLQLYSGDRLKVKAAPMCRKHLYLQRSSLDIELGPLQIFNMPLIQLEVMPKAKTPLPDIVRPYLKMALPYDNITPEWAEFAASAVQHKPKRKRRHKSKLAQTKKTFTFDIPYENYQHKVLVRKRKCPNARPIVNANLSDVDEVPFKFLNDVDSRDKTQSEVAGILARMINSVAISLNEDCFTKEDPNGIYNVEDEKILETVALKAQVKQQDVSQKTDSRKRVMRELRRLNISVISAYQQTSADICSKDICRLGCICDSLSNSQTYPAHCGKAKCIFMCTCPEKPSNIEIDCELTDNQYKHIRDRAAASLAKEEKEFTSTVVISNDKTVILPNSDQYNSGKRHKKMPKRYNDCINHSRGTKTTSDISDSECGSVKKCFKIPEIKNESTDELRNSLSGKAFVNKLVHVSVNIERMDNLLELEPWCMVHCLYKCFCKFNATKGKPFDFAVDFVERHKDERETKIKPKEYKENPKNSNKDVHKEPKETCKRRYSEDSDTSPTHSRKRSSIYATDKAWRPHCKVAKVAKFLPFNQSSSAIFEMNCARTLPVIATSIQHRNTERLETIRGEIEQHERDNPQLLVTLVKKIKTCLMTLANECPPKNDEPIMVDDSPKKHENTVLEQTVATETKENQNNSSDEPKPSTSGLVSKKFPVTKTSKPEIPMDPVALKQQQQNVKILNYIVSRSMQSICEIQRKSTLKLGPPQNKVLTFIQWSDICKAFSTNSIYVWNIQLDTNETILAVTTQHIMPVVGKAVCVINIKAVSSERLPVLAQMLKLGTITEKTKHLAVLLSGVSNFWRIIGCIHSNHEYLKTGVQVKPTPVSHPKASVKISALFQSLTKRQQLQRQEPQRQEPQLNFSSMKSNIPLLELSNQDLTSITAPIPIVDSHRLFMIEIGTDFSHLHIPAWNSFVSREKFEKALQYSQEQGKAVRISQPGHKIEVYASNREINKIFFGPYQQTDPFDLRLFMYYNRRMILLDEYHKINPLAAQVDKKTRGCWLYKKNSVLQDIKSLNNEKDTLVGSDNTKNDINNDDDDCFITEAMTELRKISTRAADQLENVEKNEEQYQNEPIFRVVEATGPENDQNENLSIENDDDCIIVEPPLNCINNTTKENENMPNEVDKPASLNHKRYEIIEKSIVHNKRMPRMKIVRRVDLNARIDDIIKKTLSEANNHPVQESQQSGLSLRNPTDKIAISASQTITNSSFDNCGLLNSNNSMPVIIKKIPTISVAQSINPVAFEKIKANNSTIVVNKVPIISSAQTINKDLFEKLSAQNPNIPKQITVENVAPESVNNKNTFEKLSVSNANIPKQITVENFNISENNRSYSPSEPPPFIIMKPPKIGCVPTSVTLANSATVTNSAILTDSAILTRTVTSTNSSILQNSAKLTNSATLSHSASLTSPSIFQNTVIVPNPAIESTKLANSAISTNSASLSSLAEFQSSATLANPGTKSTTASNSSTPMNSATSANSAATANLTSVANSVTVVNLGTLQYPTSLTNSATISNSATLTKQTTTTTSTPATIVATKNLPNMIKMTEMNKLKNSTSHLPPLTPIPKMIFSRTSDSPKPEPTKTGEYVPKLPVNTKIQVVPPAQSTVKVAPVTNANSSVPSSASSATIKIMSNQSTEAYRIPVNSFITKTTSAKTLPISNETSLKSSDLTGVSRSLLKSIAGTQTSSKMATLTPILSSRNIVGTESPSTSFVDTTLVAPATVSKQNVITVISTVPVISMIASLTNSIKNISSTSNSTRDSDTVITKSVGSICATSVSNISNAHKTVENSTPCARILKRRLSIVEEVNTAEKLIVPPKAARVVRRRHSILTVTPSGILSAKSFALQRQSVIAKQSSIASTSTAKTTTTETTTSVRTTTAIATTSAIATISTRTTIAIASTSARTTTARTTMAIATTSTRTTTAIASISVIATTSAQTKMAIASTSARTTTEIATASAIATTSARTKMAIATTSARTTTAIASTSVIATTSAQTKMAIASTSARTTTEIATTSAQTTTAIASTSARTTTAMASTSKTATTTAAAARTKELPPNNAVITIHDDDSDTEDDGNSIKTIASLSIEPHKGKIQGYFISNLQFMGKIPAEIGGHGVTIKYENKNIHVDKPSEVNATINRILRQIFFRVIPNSLLINWNFVTGPKYDYQLFKLTNIKPTMVLTNYKIVDLLDDFESDPILPLRLKEYLLIWRLASIFIPKDESRSLNALSVLDKASDVIKMLTAKENKLDNLKMYYGIKIQLKKLKLDELKNNISKCKSQKSNSLPKIHNTTRRPSKKNPKNAQAETKN